MKTWRGRNERWWILLRAAAAAGFSLSTSVWFFFFFLNIVFVLLSVLCHKLHKAHVKRWKRTFLRKYRKLTPAAPWCHDGEKSKYALLFFSDLYHSGFYVLYFSVQSCHPAESASINRAFACTFTCTKKENKLAERYHGILLNAVLLWRFSRTVHFTADKWTVQSIYAKQVLDFFFNDFFFFPISASFVTCCMSINTADFLCQCNVHVLGIILLFWFQFFWAGRVSFWRLRLNCPDQQVCVQSRRLCPQLWVDFCILYGKFKIWTEKTTRGWGVGFGGGEWGHRQKKKRKEEEFLDHFGGLVLDCITTSIWCAICDSWMFLVYLCSLHPTREKKNSRVTKCYSNAIDLVLILFNIISINNCCLPPSERPLVFSLSLSYIWAHLHKVNERNCKTTNSNSEWQGTRWALVVLNTDTDIKYIWNCKILLHVNVTQCYNANVFIQKCFTFGIFSVCKWIIMTPYVLGFIQILHKFNTDLLADYNFLFLHKRRYIMIADCYNNGSFCSHSLSQQRAGLAGWLEDRERPNAAADLCKVTWTKPGSTLWTEAIK